MKSVRLQTPQKKRVQTGRSGLTLLEMLLAASILAMSLAVLARHNGVGVRAALRAQLETEAAVLCQSQLNRLLAEKTYIEAIPEQPLPGLNSETHQWMWSVELEPSSVPELQLVTVVVFADGIHRDISTVRLSRLISAKPRVIFQGMIAGGTQ